MAESARNTSKKSPVNASFGSWQKVVNPRGELVGYRGVFAEKDKVRALGTTRYLHKSRITIDQRDLLHDGGNYVIRLWKHPPPDLPYIPDNLGKFEMFAENNNITFTEKVEGVARRSAPRNPPVMPHQSKAVPTSGAGTREAKKEFLEAMPDVIDSLPWGSIEKFPDGTSKDGKPVTAISTIPIVMLDDPKTASVVAQFLHDKHYISGKNFRRLQEEIQGDCLPVHISVSSERAGAFFEEFPNAGSNHTAPISTQTINHLHTLMKSMPSRTR